MFTCRWRASAVQHASLEAHGCVAYFEPKEDGTGERLTVCSSTHPDLPVTRDRVWLALDRHARASVAEGPALGG
ncbi:hypothetical protein [Streptomyces sp. NPDC059008]|uniref:hypothetical protein n=1 Tax=Streptomyces sp. NPDC059008 TaxID=3346693 RepID=UPI0036750339